MVSVVGTHCRSGRFFDAPERLLRAAAYLKETE